MRRRVVITGMGVISPVGSTVDELFHAQVEGRSGVRLITHFDAATFPTRFAAQVNDFDLARYVRDPGRWNDAGANSQFAAAAAQQAMTDAGLFGLPGIDPRRFGVYMGVGEGPQDYEAVLRSIAQGYRAGEPNPEPGAVARAALAAYHPNREYQQELHTPPAHLAEYFGLEGPNYGCLTSCAAGPQAIGEAADMIREGEVDWMLAGGAHSMIHPFGLTGFGLLTALSTRNDAPEKASRPFDQRRDGFVLGEGAGMLVLEEYEQARQRGATIYAELSGYGCTADAFRTTDSHPEGRGAGACMRGALADARLAPSDIGYINAHGTSTPLNDRVETLAIKQVFGEAAFGIPVSSSKSMIGHLIAAAGAVELIIAIQALRNEVLPPTINYEFPDPACDLDCIPNTARGKKVRHVLSNSFGFGGQNVSLIVSRV